MVARLADVALSGDEKEVKAKWIAGVLIVAGLVWLWKRSRAASPSGSGASPKLNFTGQVGSNFIFAETVEPEPDVWVRVDNHSWDTWAENESTGERMKWLDVPSPAVLLSEENRKVIARK